MKLIKSTKGMTMVEIIVALSILGIVALGIMGFFTDSFKFQSRSQQVAYAQKLAEETFEKLKQCSENHFEFIQNDGSEFKITDYGMYENAEIEMSDDYDTYVYIDNVEEIEELKIYDVTLEIVYNENVKGTVSSSLIIDKNILNEKTTVVIGYRKGDPGDNCQSIPLSRTVAIGNAYSVDPFAPYVKRHTFVEWKDQDGYTYEPGETLGILNNNIILTAIWKCNCCEKLGFCTSCGRADCGVGEEDPADGIFKHCKNVECKNKCTCCIKCKSGCNCPNECDDCTERCGECGVCNYVDHIYCDGRESYEHDGTYHEGHGCSIEHGEKCICGKIDCQKGCTECTVSGCWVCVVCDNHVKCNAGHHGCDKECCADCKKFPCKCNFGGKYPNKNVNKY